MRRKNLSVTAAALLGIPLGAGVTAVLLGAPLSARAEQNMEKRSHDHGDTDAGCTCGHNHGSTASVAAPTRAAAPARVVELTVTGDGFVPSQVRVKKGEPVRLAITRKVERTCATEVVIKDYGIDQPLPLGKTVYVDLTPTRSGNVRYACGMDMIGGILVVE